MRLGRLIRAQWSGSVDQRLLFHSTALLSAPTEAASIAAALGSSLSSAIPQGCFFTEVVMDMFEWMTLKLPFQACLLRLCNFQKEKMLIMSALSNLSVINNSAVTLTEVLCTAAEYR